MNPNKQHPDGAEDDLRQLAEVFRRHAPPEPSPENWDRALDAVASSTRRPAAPRRWPWVAAAGLLLALGLGYGVWQATPEKPAVANALPSGDDNDEPFAVASASEVHILSVGADDADRLAVGHPLLGAMEFAAHGDIEIVHVEPNPEDGRWAMMQPNAAVPLIVVSAVEP